MRPDGFIVGAKIKLPDITFPELQGATANIFSMNEAEQTFTLEWDWPHLNNGLWKNWRWDYTYTVYRRSIGQRWGVQYSLDQTTYNWWKSWNGDRVCFKHDGSICEWTDINEVHRWADVRHSMYPHYSYIVGEL